MSLGIKCIICILHIVENALKYPSFWRWPEMKYEMIRKFHNKARRYEADMSQQSDGGGGGGVDLLERSSRGARVFSNLEKNLYFCINKRFPPVYVPIKIMFFRLNFRNCSSCVHNCDDLSLIHYFFRSSNI